MPPDDPVEEVPVETPPAVTQAQLAALLADQKRTIEAQMKAANKAAQDEVAALKAQLAASQAPKEPTPAPDDLKGQLELVQTRHAREMEALKNQLSSLSQEKDNERKKRLETERTSELTRALQKADCLDIQAGLKLYRDDCEYDTTDERWYFRTKAGGVVSVEDGIAEALPSYLKRPQLSGGGSGSQPGAPKAQRQRALQEAIAVLETLKKKASQSNQGADRIAYLDQKKLVDRLTREATATK